ncbi:response regulator transcription factor [Devosia sp. MSA67]|uniref:Response regulator transcription factor n=2 Tax=Devosia sediminis TaxID=2798801 RepID=A0A934MJI5_9HYPH|nr:response regulator transcription factor [Devosia sediminis]
MHRIAIVDDSVLLREGLGRLIEEAGFTLAAAFGSGAELLAAMPGLEVDLLIMDVRMPPTFTDEGLRLAIQLRSNTPRLPVLILSQFVESLYAQELFANGQGFVGYLLKDRLVSIDALYDAIERIIAGGTVLDPEVVSTLINARQDPLVWLTSREKDVLGAMAEGLTNQGIANRLNIGLGTVEKHATEIFSKLELNSDTHDHRRVLAVLTWLRKSAHVDRFGQPG